MKSIPYVWREDGRLVLPPAFSPFLHRISVAEYSLVDPSLERERNLELSIQRGCGLVARQCHGVGCLWA
jgi:hypothetical protein